VNPETVTFTAAQETALITLHGKAMDSSQLDSILGDREAERMARPSSCKRTICSVDGV
jgi:O-methyltransferase